MDLSAYVQEEEEYKVNIIVSGNGVALQSPLDRVKVPQQALYCQHDAGSSNDGSGITNVEGFKKKGKGKGGEKQDSAASASLHAQGFVFAGWFYPFESAASPREVKDKCIFIAGKCPIGTKRNAHDHYTHKKSQEGVVDDSGRGWALVLRGPQPHLEFLACPGTRVIVGSSTMRQNDRMFDASPPTLEANRWTHVTVICTQEPSKQSDIGIVRNGVSFFKFNLKLYLNGVEVDEKDLSVEVDDNPWLLHNGVVQRETAPWADEWTSTAAFSGDEAGSEDSDIGEEDSKTNRAISVEIGSGKCAFQVGGSGQLRGTDCVGFTGLVQDVRYFETTSSTLAALVASFARAADAANSNDEGLGMSHLLSSMPSWPPPPFSFSQAATSALRTTEYASKYLSVPTSSQPLDSLAQLRKWSPGGDPLNVAHLSLQSAADKMSIRVWRRYSEATNTDTCDANGISASSSSASKMQHPRVIFCHDCGPSVYKEDRFPQGGDKSTAYTFSYWQFIDIFIYFSHALVNIPPPGWINAGHKNGVPVLGTFITEWAAGTLANQELLEGPDFEGGWPENDGYKYYADKLVDIAKYYGFDGWLLNIESPLGKEDSNPKEAELMRQFVKYLTKEAHSRLGAHAQVIWYDAVTIDGNVSWQRELNNKNKPFFDAADGIFIDYSWTLDNLEVSMQNAISNDIKNVLSKKDRSLDVYHGIDVFGRGTYGGGQWNCSAALAKIREKGLSSALFAPAWIYEKFSYGRKNQSAYLQAEARFWYGHGSSDNLATVESMGQVQGLPKSDRNSQTLLTNYGWAILDEERSGEGWKVCMGTKPEENENCPFDLSTSLLVIASHKWCRRSKTISLISDKVGITQEALDNCPPIHICEWFRGTGPNVKDKFYLNAEIRNKDGVVLARFESGVLTAAETWSEASTTFRNYGKGACTVYIEDGGKDAEGWAGHYGTQIGSLSVTVAKKYEESIAKEVPVRSSAFGLPFCTSFNLGAGYKQFVDGKLVSSSPWNRMSEQDILPLCRHGLPIVMSDSQTGSAELDSRFSASLAHDIAFNGGTSLLVTATGKKAFSNKKSSEKRLKSTAIFQLFKTNWNLKKGVYISAVYLQPIASQKRKLNADSFGIDVLIKLVAAQRNATEREMGEPIESVCRKRMMLADAISDEGLGAESKSRQNSVEGQWRRAVWHIPSSTALGKRIVTEQILEVCLLCSDNISLPDCNRSKNNETTAGVLETKEERMQGAVTPPLMMNMTTRYHLRIGEVSAWTAAPPWPRIPGTPTGLTYSTLWSPASLDSEEQVSHVVLSWHPPCKEEEVDAAAKSKVKVKEARKDADALKLQILNREKSKARLEQDAIRRQLYQNSQAWEEDEDDSDVSSDVKSSGDEDESDDDDDNENTHSSNDSESSSENDIENIDSDEEGDSSENSLVEEGEVTSCLFYSRDGNGSDIRHYDIYRNGVWFGRAFTTTFVIDDYYHGRSSNAGDLFTILPVSNMYRKRELSNMDGSLSSVQVPFSSAD